MRLARSDETALGVTLVSPPELVLQRTPRHWLARDEVPGSLPFEFTTLLAWPLRQVYCPDPKVEVDRPQ